MIEQHFTPEFIAKRLAVSPATIYKRIYKGELRCVRVGRAVRVPESALSEFMGGVNADVVPLRRADG